jgi:hypothetical protein
MDISAHALISGAKESKGTCGAEIVLMALVRRIGCN